MVRPASSGETVPRGFCANSIGCPALSASRQGGWIAMRRHARWTSMMMVMGLTGALLAGLPGTSHAGGPNHWTKLATIDNGFARFGMLRTSDGHLHLVWQNKKGTGNTHTYGTATLSLAGSVLGTGTAFPHW